MIRAKIEKIHAIGALTHILMKHDKQDVHITLAGSDAARYQIAEGKELNLIPRQIYVFSQNELIGYSIRGQIIRPSESLLSDGLSAYLNLPINRL